MNKILHLIDRISELTGHAISWIVVLLTLVLAYEVVMRYFFDAPTKWAYDISYMLGGTFFLMGASYTLWMKGHVRIDLFYMRFSPRKRALIDVFFYLVFFFPLWIGLLYYLIPHVYMSWELAERSLESYWRPPIYPFKTIMPIGVFLLLLQGFAEFIRSLTVLAKGRLEPQPKFAVSGSARTDIEGGQTSRNDSRAIPVRGKGGVTMSSPEDKKLNYMNKGEQE